VILRDFQEKATFWGFFKNGKGVRDF